MGPTQLKAFRRYQVPVHAGAVATAPVVPPPTGWNVVLPDIVQPRFAAAALVATGLSLVPGAINNTAANQPLGFESAPQPLTNYGLRENAPAGLVAATGLSLVPGAINPAAANQPLGFEPAPQAQPLRQPRFSNAAQSATGLSLSPQVIQQTLVNGWSINTPELPQPKFSNAAQSATGLALAPQTIVRTLPNGWTVNVPELPQFSRKQALPEYTSRIDPPPVAVQPFGFDLAPQALVVAAWRKSYSPTPKHSVGPALATAPVPPFGWVPVLPDLPQPRLSNAAQTATGLSLAPQVIQQTLVNGWTVNTPELPQFSFKRAAQTATGLSLPPQVIVQPLVNGWTVAIPDLPQFKRKQALPEYTGRIDPPAPPVPPPTGWTVNTPDALPLSWRRPHVARPTHYLGSAPSPNAAPLMVLVEVPPPPLKRVNPVAAGLRQAITFAFFDQPPTWGWVVEPPHLRQQQRVVLTDPTGRLDPPAPVAQPPSGWTVNTPELPQPNFRCAAQAATGVALVPGAINNAAANEPLGFEWAPQAFVTYAPRSASRAAQTATGLSLAPQTIVQSLVNGWTVNTPDLPQFRRKQALPEYTGKIDPPPLVALLPMGWPAVLPDLPQPKLSSAAQVATGLSLPPQVIRQPLVSGWEFSPQPVPLRWPVRDPRMPFVAGLDLAPQPIIQPFPYGWSVALPELPQPKLSNAAQTAASGLSLTPQPIVQPLVNGWTVNTPELPQPKLRNAAQAATGLALAPQVVLRPLVTGWSVTILDLVSPFTRCRFETPFVDLFAVPPPPPAVFVCVRPVTDSPYSAVAVVGDVADYKVGGFDSADFASAPFDVAYDATSGLTTTQLYGAVGGDSADFAATRSDVAYWQVAVSEFACKD